MNNRERKIVMVAGVSHAMAHFFEILFPAMTMYVVNDLNLPIHVVIKAGFLLYLLYGCLAPFWGYVADRYGASLTLSIGMLMAGGGAIVAGNAGGLATLWIALGIIGTGIASAHPAGMSLISKSVAKRGDALGLFGICGNLGIVSAPLIGGIGGYYLGWRKLMVISGVFGVLAGILSSLIRIGEHKHTDKAYTQKIPIKHAALCFVTLCFAMTLAGFIYRANLITLPVYFEERPTAFTEWLNNQNWLGISHIVNRGGREKTLGATLLISLAVFIGIIGQKVGGYTADRTDLRWSYFTFFLIALPALFSMALLHGWALVGVTSIFMIFSLGMQPIENSLVARLTPPKWRSTAYGIKFILAFGIGSFAVWPVSVCMNRWNTSSVYIFLAGLQVLLLTIIGVVIFISRGIDMRQYSVKPQTSTQKTSVGGAGTNGILRSNA